MGKIFGRTKITTSEKEIQARIVFALRKTVDEKFRRAAPVIRRLIKNLVVDEFSNDDTIVSIQHGKLKSDFGLGAESVNIGLQILQAIRDTVRVRLVSGRGNKLIYQLIVEIQPKKLDNILSIEGAEYHSNQSLIKWLEWLLKEGTRVIVEGFEPVDRPEYSDYSRSGSTIMVKNAAGVFRVDPSHAGTEDDNFITRGLARLAPEISEIVRTEIKKRI